MWSTTVILEERVSDWSQQTHLRNNLEWFISLIEKNASVKQYASNKYVKKKKNQKTISFVTLFD